MGCSEFRRWLLSQGVVMKPGNGTSHFRLYYNGLKSTFAYHKGKEMPEGTRRRILRDLGLKD